MERVVPTRILIEPLIPGCPPQVNTTIITIIITITIIIINITTVSIIVIIIIVLI